MWHVVVVSVKGRLGCRSRCRRYGAIVFRCASRCCCLPTVAMVSSGLPSLTLHLQTPATHASFLNSGPSRMSPGS